MEIIKDLRLLKRMQKNGHITLHPQTGKTVTWYGQKSKAWYVDDATSYVFDFEGQRYELKYFDGCFYPFIVKKC